MKLKKSDEIIVTIGKDKGRKGKIEKIFPKNQTVQVNGINVFKRHLRKRDEKTPGGIIDLIKPIAISKIALICPKCKKPTRIGFLISKKDKNRICKKCKQLI